MNMDDNKSYRSYCRTLTEEESYEYVYTDVEFSLILIVAPFICILGLFFNVAYLLVLYRERDLRTTTNFYLANLAVADGFLLLVRLVRYIGTYVYSPIDYHNITPFTDVYSCGIPILLINLFSFASVFFILFVASERYFSICRPLTHRGQDSSCRALILTLIGWTVPLIFVCCHLGSFDLQDICIVWSDSLSVPKHFKTCSWMPWVAISLLVFDNAQIWMALITSCAMYIAIIRTLSKKKGKQSNCSHEQDLFTKMLLINTFVFFICLMPMQVIDLMTLMDKICDLQISQLLPRTFFWVAIVLSLINSAINPLIYNAVIPNYRKAFKRAFCVSLCSRKETKHAVDEMQWQEWLYEPIF